MNVGFDLYRTSIVASKNAVAGAIDPDDNF